MSEVRRLLEDTVTRLFAAVTPERLVDAEGGAFLGALWQAVEENGLTAAHLGVAAGGAGAGWREAAVIARASGRHAVPLPIAESMLAGWLLERAGLVPPAGPLTIAPTPLSPEALAAPTLSATLSRVPWGRHTAHVVVTAPHPEGVRVALVRREGAEVTEGCNLALEPRDTVRVRASRPPQGTAHLPADALVLHGALLRAAQMAGALETALDLSVRHAGERVQFGRPIGSFQAVQQELARLAGLVAAAGTAAEAAAAAADEAIGPQPAPDPAFAVAVAKVVAGDAAEHAPRIAHQVHGAIGFTYEHRLHFFTRRLWAWRAEFGTAETWAERLGGRVLAAGADALWPIVTAHRFPSRA